MAMDSWNWQYIFRGKVAAKSEMAEGEEAIQLKTVAMEPNDCPLASTHATVVELPAELRAGVAGGLTLRAARWSGLCADDQDDIHDRKAGRKGRVGSQVHGGYGVQAQAHWSLLLARCCACERAWRSCVFWSFLSNV